jgi:xanthine dehydrogenase accessory factor
MKVLILGAGELASSIAHRLFRCGFDVAMTEVNEPLAVRRAVSFCSAVWDGQATVEGVTARRREPGEALATPLDHVAVFVDPESTLVAAWQPDVLVDGRLLKRAGATAASQAPLVISLGPGAVCGREAHLVVETHRGHDLGRLIDTGGAAADTGIPGPIGGVAAERVLRAPAAGRVRGILKIGDPVAAGDLVAWVGEHPVRSGIAGVLRGIVHDGVQVTAKLKLGDVDPRGDVRACFTLSDKGRTISGAVLEGILNRFPAVRP